MKKMNYLLPLILLLISLLLFSGCKSEKSVDSSDEPPVFSPLQALVPIADGTEVIGNTPLNLDISNYTQGYMIAESTSTDSKLNIQLTGPDNAVYSSFLEPEETAVIPFTSGNGTYQLLCYQQISADKYAALFSEILEVSLDNQFLPFLYPNQYVDFSPDSEAVKLALSMMPEDTSDIDALSIIYSYVTENITYDYEKAESVENGYLPDIDDTLNTKTGICFDYAALMTAMLRTRGIPCKLQIGYSSDLKHAWIDVYIRSKGWVNQAIAFDGETWTLMDPTFEASSRSTEELVEYIGDGSFYTVQFSR